MLISSEQIFFNLIDRRFNFDTTGVRPYTNIYGLWIFHSDAKQIQVDINNALPYCDHLFVMLNEPTRFNILELVKHNPTVHFFSDFVVNGPKPNNFDTAISWFVEPINYYADSEHEWTETVLKLVNPVTNNNRPFLFDCLLGRKKLHRDCLHANISLNEAIRNRVYMQYYSDKIPNGNWKCLNLPGHTIEETSEHNIRYDNGFEINRYSVLPHDIYNKSYYSIVAETSVFAEFSQITEKTCKPILAKRPFLILGGHNYLKNLRSLGFKTFSHVIDESYDSIEDVAERTKALVKSAEELSKLDPVEVYHATHDEREHNYRLFMNTNWHHAVSAKLNSLL